MYNKIFFRADADAKIGFGHFIRTLALANMLRDDFECVFFTSSPTNYQIDEVKKICKLIELPEGDSKFDEFLTYLTGTEIVFLDNYFFSSEYEKKIKNIGCRLIVLSTPTNHHFADVVLNYLETDYSKYSVEPYTKIYAGKEWTILRQPFLLPFDDTKRKKDSVVISFGGTDQYCLTEKVIDNIKCKHISVICTSRINASRIQFFKEHGIDVYVDVSAETVAKEFETHEFAILSSSTICIEALSRGCKVLAGYYIDNQVNYYKYISDEKAVYPLGNLLLKDAFDNLNVKLADCQQIKRKTIDFTNQRDNYIKIFKELCI